MKKHTKAIYFISVLGGNTCPVNCLQITAKQYKEASKNAKSDFKETYSNDEELREDNGAEMWKNTDNKRGIKKTSFNVREGCCWVIFEKYEIIEKDKYCFSANMTAEQIRSYFEY